jgi:hypothetical protein
MNTLSQQTKKKLRKNREKQQNLMLQDRKAHKDVTL